MKKKKDCDKFKGCQYLSLNKKQSEKQDSLLIK